MTTEPGPNGCVCGHNGDCNCPYVSATRPRAKSKDYQGVARELFDVLKLIAKGYQTPEQLRRAIERRGNPLYGLSFDEALEMAYENMQGEAIAAIKGRRRP